MWNWRDRSPEDIECFHCKMKFHPQNPIWSGVFVNKVVSDNEHIYCGILCAKSHEKELIKQGKIQIEPIGSHVYAPVYTARDEMGNPIWFPKSGKPYYDRALKRTFNNVHEKQAHLKEKGLVMDGSTDKVNQPWEAGDMRSRSRRKQLEEYGV